jgi:hypothetical protein
MPLQSSRSFRRVGQRDDRRRRLLTDELANPTDWPTCAASSEDSPQQRSEHYGDAGFLERQLRLLDLVPRRVLSLVFLIGAGVVIVVGLEAAYVWMLDRVAASHASVVALDLAVKGSLACWFSSLTLLAASAVAVLVYCVRRHRIDDYQGRYRIWLWAATCWFLLATDQAASLREAFRDLMVSLTGTNLVGDGTLWWVSCYALVLGAVGSRLLVDMRCYALSAGVLVGAALLHVLALGGRWGYILPQGGRWEVMSIAGVELAGNLMLLAAMTLYARFVVLDAEGLWPRRESEECEVPDEEFDELEESRPMANDAWQKVDSSHTVPPPVRRPATPVSTSTVSSPSSAPPLSPVNRKLTKGERKALKERLLRQRMEREGRM